MNILNHLFSLEKFTRIGPEDMQEIIKQKDKYIIINTLSTEYQHCVIPGTLPDTREESIINEMLNRIDIPDKPIIIYGKNNQDESIDKKYNQLKSLGIHEIYIYSGGMFEWLLLNDVYGSKLYIDYFEIN